MAIRKLGMDELLCMAAKQMRGTVRRRFLAVVCERLCDGSARRAEERFGWGRETIAKGQAERDSGPSATAILDRFLYHAEVIAITGRSYRLRNQAILTATTADDTSENSKTAIPPTGSSRGNQRNKEAAASAETCPS